MKANELRIGNYIYSFGDILKIDLNDICNVECSTDDVFEPIPLTEEWLLKFGFEKINNEYWYMYYAFCINEYFDVFGIKVTKSWQNIYGIKIRYVHQLQNLYFALTGQELTFKE